MKSMVGLRAVADDRSVDRFAEIVTADQKRLLGLAFLLTGDRFEAEDALAEATASVLARWRRGPIDNVLAYLRTALVNEVRRRGRRATLARREEIRRKGDHRGALTVAQHISDREEIVAALAELGEGQRLAIVLRFFADLSVADTADAMGVAEGTVKSQVARGLENMRALLEEDGR